MAKADKTSRGTRNLGVQGTAGGTARGLAFLLATLTAAPLALPVMPFLAAPAEAQNLFAPRVYVNEQAIPE